MRALGQEAEPVQPSRPRACSCPAAGTCSDSRARPAAQRKMGCSCPVSKRYVEAGMVLMWT